MLITVSLNIQKIHIPAVIDNKIMSSVNRGFNEEKNNFQIPSCKSSVQSNEKGIGGGGSLTDEHV